MYISVARPYYAVLFLIPFTKWVKEKKYVSFAVLPVMAVLSLGVYFINTKYFCSKYFESAIHFSLKNVTEKILEGVNEISHMIWYSIRYKDSSGWSFLIFFTALGIMLISVVWRKIKRQPISKMYVICLITMPMILMSFMVMYSLLVCARHLLALNVSMIFIIIMESNYKKVIPFVLINVLSLILTGGISDIPYAKKEYAEYMDSLKETFEEIIHLTDELSYDNVIAMPTSDVSAEDGVTPVATYYGLMYAVPSGMGVSLDFASLYENSENIKAKYILCAVNGSIRGILINKNMKCIFENDEFALYMQQ